MPNNTHKIDKVIVRMYRMGTGDFFLLKFKSGDTITFKLMIDCGCINGAKADFIEMVKDLNAYVDGSIDLLVITHEHADHINGFNLASEEFNKIDFKKVWFSWTESKDDNLANDLRKNHAELEKAIALASTQLSKLVEDKTFETMFKEEFDANLMIEGKKHFVEVVANITNLNSTLPLDGRPKPTMEDIMRENKVIKENTIVEFWDPGKLIENIEGLTGIRFFVLGPPKSNAAIKIKEKKGEGFEKREKPSTVDLAFLNVFNTNAPNVSENEILPFEENYIFKTTNDLVKSYKNTSNNWRNIENDWLFSAGNLALRHETSINNTSLALAIQFIDSEKILLFPGDAEHGNWLSWHNEGMEWSIKIKNETKTVKAEYILNNTVFYKVGHHLSQNGTVKQKGLDMMTQDDLAAMATLDFNKINNGWLNTMPNDIIGAELIRKTKGKLFFVGDRNVIVKNIKTNRVSISQTNLKNLEKLNKDFDDKNHIDFEVKG